MIRQSRPRLKSGLCACAGLVMVLAPCWADEKTPAPERKPDSKSERTAPDPLTAYRAALQSVPPSPAERRPNGSLWNSSSRAVTEDIRARRVGDVLTIVVQESATASSTASTKSSKSDEASFGGGTGFLGPLLKGFGASAAGSSSGQGQTSRTGLLSTRISVIVREVLPNGYLFVEGTRLVTINKETQKVTLTGIIRPEDVSPDNSVSSIQVANAAIQLDGKGTVGDRQKKGIISRIFDWIF